MHTSARVVSSIFLGLVASACADGFDDHEPFEGEIYLCDVDQADAWSGFVTECRGDFDDDRSCAGVVSFRGTLQGQPVVVTDRLESTEFRNLLRSSDASIDRRGFSLAGASPYFFFELDFDYIGGDEDAGAIDRSFTIGESTDVATRYEDDLFEGALRISSGLSSRDQNFRSGSMHLTLQTVDSEAGTFEATTFGSDRIEGCFQVFDADPELEVEAP